MSCFVPEKLAQSRALALSVAGKVREYFSDEQHRREFETWYEERYGKKYEWKRVTA